MAAGAATSGARPPLSLERLSALPDGRLVYRLKRPLPGGREVLVLQPTELLRRLATLVPPPPPAEFVAAIMHSPLPGTPEYAKAIQRWIQRY